MPKVTKDGKEYHFPYTAKGIGAAEKMKSEGKGKKNKKKTMFSRNK
jgi:hypothetical protein